MIKRLNSAITQTMTKVCAKKSALKSMKTINSMRMMTKWGLVTTWTEIKLQLRKGALPPINRYMDPRSPKEGQPCNSWVKTSKRRTGRMMMRRRSTATSMRTSKPSWTRPRSAVMVAMKRKIMMTTILCKSSSTLRLRRAVRKRSPKGSNSRDQ